MTQSRVISEEAIIEQIFRPLAKGNPAAFDLRDDAAALAAPAMQDVILTTDTLVAGVHFLPDDPPHDIAKKAVTANLSDLVAKGADPVGYLLALTLPRGLAGDERWLKEFQSGLRPELLKRLLGGDLTVTDGPLVITITAVGQMDEGSMPLRSSAGPGAQLFVSRTIGSSWLGLKILQDPGWANEVGLDKDEKARLISRYRAPRIPAAEAMAWLVRDFAVASIDVSDGLAKDLGRMAVLSRVGAEIHLECVPVDPAARRLLDAGYISYRDIVTGGDDYCVLMAVSERRVEVFQDCLSDREFRKLTMHHIGAITEAEHGVRFILPDGSTLEDLGEGGHDHFAGL